jgi:ADP-ribose pyrophosphatase
VKSSSPPRKKIERTEEVLATPWFSLLAKRLEGDPDPYYSLRLSDYACVVAQTPAGEIVLVEQFRHAVEDLALELPSGLVDSGESPLEAAKRELEEETGMTAEDWCMLGSSPLHPDTGRLGNRLWCFYARNARPMAGARRADDTDSIKVILHSPGQLREALDAGRFNHALHVAPLLLAVLGGHLQLP